MCALAALGGAAVCLVEPHLDSIGALCIAAFLRMAAPSFMWPPLMAWLSETTDRGSLSRVIGGYNVTWALGILAGYYLGGWTFQHHGFAVSFSTAGTMAFGTLAFILLFAPERAHRQVHEQDDLDPVAARAFVRQGLLLNVGGCFTMALVLYMFPKIVGKSMGEEAQSVLHSVRMGGQVVAFMLMGSTHAWHYRRWPMWVALAALTAGIACVAGTSRYGIYVGGFALLGVGMGIAYTLSAYYVLALMRVKGLGSGLQETLIGTGFGIGPLYGGAVASFSSARMSVAAGIIPLVLLAPLLHVRHRHPNRQR
jgi:MFS family permease